MRNLSYCFLALICLVSCKEGTPDKVTVDSVYWGEEIVYNESGHDLTMIIYGREGDELSLEIPDGQSDTLALPSMEYVVSITMSSDSVKIVFDDGRQITTQPSEDLLYGTYELEEKTVYENGAAVDKLWPIYRYRITEKHYEVAKTQTDQSGGEDNGFGNDTKWEMKISYPVDTPSDVADFFDTKLPDSSGNSDTGFALDDETCCVVIDNMEEFKAIAPTFTDLPEIDFATYTLIIGRMVSDSPNLVYRNQSIGIGENRTLLTVGYTANIGESSETITYYNFWGLYEKLPEWEVELKVVIL